MVGYRRDVSRSGKMGFEDRDPGVSFSADSGHGYNIYGRRVERFYVPFLPRHCVGTAINVRLMIYALSM